MQNHMQEPMDEVTPLALCEAVSMANKGRDPSRVKLDVPFIDHVLWCRLDTKGVSVVSGRK